MPKCLVVNKSYGTAGEARRFVLVEYGRTVWGKSMYKKITVPVVRAWLALAAVLGACQLCCAEGGAGEDDYRVVAMEKDQVEKAAAGAGAWDEIFKANNYDKLTGSDEQIRKAELAEDFDADILDRERQLDWYGAAEECAGKGRLPDHKELLKIWDAECKESTAAVCSAVYWTSEKKEERALGVNFLNGYVVPKDLDAFAYVRCVAGKQGRKPAAARPSAKAGNKKGGDASAKVIAFVRNYLPMPDGPKLWDKMAVMIFSAGGSTGAVSWEVKKKGPGLFSASSVVPAGDGEIKFTFNVNMAKKTVTPADARAKDVFKAIIDPDIAEGDMH